MNFKDAQDLCSEAKRKYLIDSTKNLVKKVRNNAELSDSDEKVQELLGDHFRTTDIVLDVLDKLYEEFWIEFGGTFK